MDGLHSWFADFVHKIVIHRRGAVGGSDSAGSSGTRAKMVTTGYGTPAPFVQCQADRTPGVMADPGRIDEEFQA